MRAIIIRCTTTVYQRNQAKKYPEHTDAIPLRDSICGKSFSENLLTNHKHTDAIPLWDSICGKKLKNGLNRLNNIIYRKTKLLEK